MSEWAVEFLKHMAESTLKAADNDPGLSARAIAVFCRGMFNPEQELFHMGSFSFSHDLSLPAGGAA